MSQISSPPRPGTNQAQTTDQEAITADDVDFVMRIFARAETESLVRNRMAIRDLKDRSKRHRHVSQFFDIEGDVETSLHLIECLPQGSRAIQPPCEEFLQLAKKVSSESSHPECILERAILLEEYALHLLTPRNAKMRLGSAGVPSSPSLVLSGIEGRLPPQSEVALSWPDRWAVRQMRRLLGAASCPDPQGRGRRPNRSGRHTRQGSKTLPGKRQRQTAVSGVRTEDSELGVGDTSDSYSSDYYSSSSHEELGSRDTLEEGKEKMKVGRVEELHEGKGKEEDSDILPRQRV